MKLATFVHGGATRIGVVVGDAIENPVVEQPTAILIA